ncbi:MAG TPA: ABC transporter ATP-binding protein, partial [Planctomycetota bacterium]|nr:ABC transporter ATP-binding protein [Planctomycetota bacterium]
MASESEEASRKDAGEDGSIANAGAWRWLIGLAGPHKARLALGGVSLVLSTAIQLVLPKFAGQTVDEALGKLDVAGMERLIGVLIALFAGRGVLVFAEVYTLRTAAARVLQDLRTRLHAKLMTLTPAFYESQRTGDLLSRLGNDVDQVAGAITDELIQGADRLLSLIGALAILLVLHRDLTLVMLLAVPPVMVVAVLFGIRLERLSKQRQDAFAAAGVVAEESLSGIRTVQAFTREPDERGRYGAKIGTATELAFRTARAWGLFSATVSFFAFSAIVCVLGYGGYLVTQHQLTAGRLTSFMLYTFQVAGSVAGLTGLYATMKTAIGATERVRGILETEPAVKDTPGAQPLPRPVRGHVELRDVAFSYASAADRKALKGVNLEAKPGEVVALVGPSGAGKSTIVNLVLRFYDAAAGAVTLDGKDVRGVTLESLR